MVILVLSTVNFACHFVVRGTLEPSTAVSSFYARATLCIGLTYVSCLFAGGLKPFRDSAYVR